MANSTTVTDIDFSAQVRGVANSPILDLARHLHHAAPQVVTQWLGSGKVILSPGETAQVQVTLDFTGRYGTLTEWWLSTHQGTVTVPRSDEPGEDPIKIITAPSPLAEYLTTRVTTVRCEALTLDELESLAQAVLQKKPGAEFQFLDALTPARIFRLIEEYKLARGELYYVSGLIDSLEQKDPEAPAMMTDWAVNLDLDEELVL
jgi:hypothetical protein